MENSSPAGGSSLSAAVGPPLVIGIRQCPDFPRQHCSSVVTAGGRYCYLDGLGQSVVDGDLSGAKLYFFGRSGYQCWKILHRLSGVAALLAVIHTLMLERALPYPWGEIIWLMLIIVAGISLFYSLVLKRRSGEYSYTVEEVNHPANNVVELALRAEGEGKSLSYQPGQFVYLTHYQKELAGCGEEHPYTLSSARGDLLARITIKALGDASFAIQEIPLGSRVNLNGPYGAFFPEQSDGKELWIAGGIGITPFLGCARHLASCLSQVDIELIYCV